MVTYADPPTTAEPTRPGMTPVRRIAVVVAILIVAQATLGLISVMSRTTTVTHKTFAVESSVLTVDTESTDVEVRAGDVEDVELTRTVDAGLMSPVTTETSDADGIHLSADCRTSWIVGMCDVDYLLVVPRDMRVNIEAGSGDVKVDGVSADVTVSVGSGSIELSDLTGTVDAETSSGDIDLARITGDLTAVTSSGSINADRIDSDEVDASASSGDVSLTFANAPSTVDVQTGSGDISIEVPNDGNAYKIDAENSEDNTIDVPIDSNSDRVISAVVGSGDISIEAFGTL